MPKMNMPVHHRRRDFLRSGGARSFRRSDQGQGHQCRCHLRRRPPQRRHADHPRTGQAALDAAGHLSVGPGWYEDQYIKTLGKLSDGPMSFVPWYDPNKKLSKALEDALAAEISGYQSEHQHVYTFEALLVAADAISAPARPIPRRWPKRCGPPTSRQCQHRPRHLVQCQGPERQDYRRRHSEPRRQADHDRAQRGRQRPAGMAMKSYQDRA